MSEVFSLRWSEGSKSFAAIMIKPWFYSFAYCWGWYWVRWDGVESMNRWVILLRFLVVAAIKQQTKPSSRGCSVRRSPMLAPNVHETWRVECGAHPPFADVHHHHHSLHLSIFLSHQLAKLFACLTFLINLKFNSLLLCVCICLVCLSLICTS